MSRLRNAPSGPTRMDLRPQNDPATQAGMRGVHRGMGGEVIGGYTPSGQALGTKRQQGPADGSRIGNPSTPGLDRWRSMNPGAPTGQAAITAASGNSVRTAAAPTGSQLLKDRQALHSEMKKGVTPDMQERAKTLGITEASWKRVAGKMPHTMAMMPGAKQGGGMPNATPATPANYQGAVQGGAGGKPYGSEYKAPDEFAGSSLVYRNRTRLFAPNPSEVVKRKVPHPSDSTNFEIPTANIDPGQGITKALRKS